MSRHTLSLLPTIKAKGGLDNEIVTAVTPITDSNMSRGDIQLSNLAFWVGEDASFLRWENDWKEPAHCEGYTFKKSEKRSTSRKGYFSYITELMMIL